MKLGSNLLLAIMLFIFNNLSLASESILVPGTGLIAGNLKTNAFFSLDQPAPPKKSAYLAINVKKEKGMIKLRINHAINKHDLSKLKTALREVTHQLKNKKVLPRELLSMSHLSSKRKSKLKHAPAKVALHKVSRITNKKMA